jgi:hypothetical protein
VVIAKSGPTRDERRFGQEKSIKTRSQEIEVPEQLRSSLLDGIRNFGGNSEISESFTQSEA